MIPCHPPIAASLRSTGRIRHPRRGPPVLVSGPDPTDGRVLRRSKGRVGLPERHALPLVHPALSAGSSQTCFRLLCRQIAGDRRLSANPGLRLRGRGDQGISRNGSLRRQAGSGPGEPVAPWPSGSAARTADTRLRFRAAPHGSMGACVGASHILFVIPRTASGGDRGSCLGVR
jgi:hypothetical protein